MTVKKQLKKYLTTIFFVTAITHSLSSTENTLPQYFEFPKPTGDYAVGTDLIELVDKNRLDSVEGKPAKPRRLEVQAWYPIEGKLDKPTSPYTYEALKMFKRGNTQEQQNMLDLIRIYSISKGEMKNNVAPQILKNKTPYPVVIFAHGNGVLRGEYSSLCEDLASQGYIVFMVMHTYTTQLTRFEDGSETEFMYELDFEVALNCMTDIEFMIDNIQNGAFKELTKFCDFKNVGIVGHSLGGIIANYICRQDSRIKAGISLDGPLYGPGTMDSLNKPFMFMIAPTFYEKFGVDEGLAVAGMTKDEFAKSIETFCQANNKDSYKIILKDAEHCTFSDAAILAIFFKQIFNRDDIDTATGKIDGFKAIEITRSYICSFFDKHLKGQPSKLLDGTDKRYVENVDFNNWTK